MDTERSHSKMGILSKGTSLRVNLKVMACLSPQLTPTKASFATVSTMGRANTLGVRAVITKEDTRTGKRADTEYM